ncbi:MAG: metallophosphoesterase [Acidobacteria bacterium]|nr:metallophosphoesterase [Acidobacteriota bacterium]
MIAALVVACWAGTVPAPAKSQESLIAIGDVHGDFDDFVGILQHTSLIDKQNHWTGSNITLVQVGDLLDRGPKPRQVMDLLMALEKEAPQDGGRVVSLLGNHEMMNIMGDLRYVTPENYASFADANSEERRRSAYRDYIKWRESHSAVLAELPHPLEITEAEWMARHPAGFIEQREAFSPKGTYGKWLRGHDALAEINGVIFLHGGISPSLASMTLSAINSHIRDEISTFDSCKQYMVDERLILPFFNLQEIVSVVQAEISAEQKSKIPGKPELRARLSQFAQFPEWLSVRTDGPLWFRGYDQWSDEEGSAQVDKILQSFKASHLVVGHTVQKEGRIRDRFGGKALLIDTGMLSSYYPGGRASALEIRNSVKFTAEYMDQQVVLFEVAKVSRLTRELEAPEWRARGEWISPGFWLREPPPERRMTR